MTCPKKFHKREVKLGCAVSVPKAVQMKGRQELEIGTYPRRTNNCHSNFHLFIYFSTQTGMEIFPCRISFGPILGSVIWKRFIAPKFQSHHLLSTHLQALSASRATTLTEHYTLLKHSPSRDKTRMAFLQFHFLPSGQKQRPVLGLRNSSFHFSPHESACSRRTKKVLPALLLSKV